MNEQKKILEKKNLEGKKAQNMKCKTTQVSLPWGGHCSHQLQPWLIAFHSSSVFFFSPLKFH